MKVRTLIGEGIKVVALLGAIAVALWSMPEHPDPAAQPAAHAVHPISR